MLTILEEAEMRGLATGVVATATVTHATPAACYAHAGGRTKEEIVDSIRGFMEQGYRHIRVQMGGYGGIPADDVKPETAVNYEFGTRLDAPIVGGEVIGFVSDYANLTEICGDVTTLVVERTGADVPMKAGRDHGLTALMAGASADAALLRPTGVSALPHHSHFRP